MSNVRRPRSTCVSLPDSLPTGCSTTIATLEKKVILTARSRDSEFTLTLRSSSETLTQRSSALFEQIDILRREIASVAPPGSRSRYRGQMKAL